MARLLTEGFEMQDFVGWTGNSTIDTSTKRSGLASVLIPSGNTGSYFMNAGIPSVSEVYCRVGVNCPDPGLYSDGWNGLYIKFRNNTTTVGYIGAFLIGGIRIYSTNTGTTFVAGGTTSLSYNTWYSIEIHIAIGNSGIIEVKLDGCPEVSWSGDTQPGANSTFNNLWIGVNGYDDGYIDDIAINDTTGGVDNSWCGNGYIVGTFPTETISHQLTGSDADTTDNHLLVDEVPSDSDTTYVEGSVVDEEDLYGFAPCSITDSTINRVWVEARAKDTVAPGGLLALITKASGGAEVSGGDVSLLDTYTKKILSAEQLTNPVTVAPWEISETDDIQAGPRTRS